MADQKSSSGQGAVQHPESDKRLKENHGNDKTGKSSQPDRDEDGKFTKDDDSKQHQTNRGNQSAKK
jgi:hypothetical protein